MFLQEVLEGLFLLELLLSQHCPVKQPNGHHCHDHTSTQPWSRGESQSLPYLSTWYARNTLTSIYTRQTLRRDTNQQHCLDVLFHPAANPYIHSNKEDVYRRDLRCLLLVLEDLWYLLALERPAERDFHYKQKLSVCENTESYLHTHTCSPLGPASPILPLWPRSPLNKDRHKSQTNKTKICFCLLHQHTAEQTFE